MKGSYETMKLLKLIKLLQSIVFLKKKNSQILHEVVIGQNLRKLSFSEKF